MMAVLLTWTRLSCWVSTEQRVLYTLSGNRKTASYKGAVCRTVQSVMLFCDIGFSMDIEG
jgi:hypothetical protein